MINKIKICDKCKGTNIKSLIPRLKAIDNDINIDVGCHNFCGIGHKKSFAILNNIPITADNEDSLIIEIKTKIKKD
ncbi:MAG: DUF1450 domain-containing protein [Bacilli bacterium]|nr:DUF1450 domain-containing protein [Bacilli bacterium]